MNERNNELPSSADEAGRLKEIQAREQAATKGPWTSDEEDEPQIFAQHRHQLARVFAGESVRVAEFDKLRLLRKRNAEFIAHARSDVPFLLAIIDALVSGNISPEQVRHALQETEGQERSTPPMAGTESREG